MSAFSSLVYTGWSRQDPHCQLSLSSFRVDSVIPPSDVAKMDIPNGDNDVSGNSQSLMVPLTVNVCYKLLSLQSCPWNNQIPSVTAIVSAGRRPIVPSFRPFIDRSIVRSCSQQPQLCMQFAQLRAQLNLSLQWAYPHPYHVKKHTGSNTATSSSMSPLCTQVCSYPIKDSDRAVCYSLATSLLDHTVLSSISLSSPMWIQSIKSSVGSSERVAGICRSVWSFVPDSMFGLWCDPTSPGEARPSLRASARAGGYAQNLDRASRLAIPSSFDSPMTTTASLALS